MMSQWAILATQPCFGLNDWRKRLALSKRRKTAKGGSVGTDPYDTRYHWHKCMGCREMFQHEDSEELPCPFTDELDTDTASEMGHECGSVEEGTILC